MAGVPQVYLDSNVLIKEGKPPESPLLERVGDLVTAGHIKLLTTDLTKAEVAKKHADNDYELIKDVGRPHFRRVLRNTLNVALPSQTKTEIRERLDAQYKSSVDVMLKSLGALELSIDDVKPASIFDAYTSRSGFFSADGKKDQFPDAFIFERLIPLISDQEPMIIVSDDGDFRKPSETIEGITLLKSLAELFKHLSLEVEDPQAEAYLDGQDELLRNTFSEELKNWSFFATDINDAEIEPLDVTEVNDLVVTSFGEAEDGGRILLVGSALLKVNVWFSHPDWENASYDSEDKVLIPHGEVDGETSIETRVNFSMVISRDEARKPVGIEEVQFVDDDFVWVELYQYDYDY